MDPQQRILLQLAWEALEDAGIPPSNLAGTDVGVFVGGSVSENAHAMYGDPSIADSHFATGNALAILANRISHVFDLRGPSLTIDTACSSSLVAIHQAVEAIRSGRIETAIVGGINILAAPTSFVSFSQASMLSPTGRCRAFSADADGYVRAEGGGVLVLRKAAHARAENNQIHGIILACEVNSDGRTNGIALPSREAQEKLLRRAYERAEISAERLAFIEAHGTGTPAGDPIEASAIGNVLGRERSRWLPIGSIKTNIGHLEPASGLAGLIKAILALNNGILPPSLHFTAPNPKIDFDALNLKVCLEPLKLPDADQQYAGINSFGFGGTNAHAIVAPGFKEFTPIDLPPLSDGFFCISAESRPALIELAGRYRDRIAGQTDQSTARIAAAAIHRRDRLTNRLVVTSTRQADVSAALDAFVEGGRHDLLAVGEAVGRDAPLAWIYTGNGSQWKGMGCAAYGNCAAFRSHFNEIDRIFAKFANWSLRKAIFDEDLAKRLEATSIAQPLIFAIQSAATFALRVRGLEPLVVLGHSVGEIAAAEAAGILDLSDAAQLIYFRSLHQERVRKAGRMLAVLADTGTVNSLIEDIEDVEIAAYNGPRALTIAGPTASVAKFAELAKRRGIVCIDLSLDYPFHSKLMDPIESALLRDLRRLKPRAGKVDFISTVTGAQLAGGHLDAGYWWRNVRKPVQFVSAVRAAAKLGARVFFEIGPRGVLTKHIIDSLAGETEGYTALSAFEQDEPPNCNPIDKAAAKALAVGARVDMTTIAGPDPAGPISLPTYPWQQKSYRSPPTPEAIGWFQGEHHPLCGARNDGDALEWHGFIDTALLPEFADHRLADRTVLPGTGFLEIALSVARQWLSNDAITLTDFETYTPLDLTGAESFEIMTRISPGSRTFEIFSRPRLSQNSWTLHSTGKIVAGSSTASIRKFSNPTGGKAADREALYQIADASGLHYGPAFALVRTAVLHHNTISIELDPQPSPRPYLLDPLRLDSCCHGLILLFPQLRTEERGVAYIPVRVDEVNLHRAHAVPRRSIIKVLRHDERSIRADIQIFAADNTVIATLRGVRCRPIAVRRSYALDAVAFVERIQPADGSLTNRYGLPATLDEITASLKAVKFTDIIGEPNRYKDAERLLDGWATTVAYEIAAALAQQHVVNIDALTESGRLAPHLRPWLAMIMSKLTVAKLAERHGSTWLLAKNPMLPTSTSVVRRLAARHPERAGELFVAAELTGLAKKLRSESLLGSARDCYISKIALDFYDVAAASTAAPCKALIKILRQLADYWPQDRVLRVLQVGYGALVHDLLKLDIGPIELTVLETDRRKFEKAKLSLVSGTNVRLIDKLEATAFDLAVAAETLHLLRGSAVLPDLRKALAPGGLLLAVQTRSSFFKELIAGLRAPSEAGLLSHAHTYPAARQECSLLLRTAGFGDSRIEYLDDCSDDCLLQVIIANTETSVLDYLESQPSNTLIVTQKCPASIKLADALKQRLTGVNPRAEVKISEVSEIESEDPISALVIQLLSPDENTEDQNSLADLCLRMKLCAERFASKATTLWHVFHKSATPLRKTQCPVQQGAWAFSRTLSNEFPHLNVRRIAIAEDLCESKAANRILSIMFSRTAETELHVDDSGIGTVRVQRFVPPPNPDAKALSAATLERRTGSLRHLVWQPTKRQVPAANEVEIEVAATGLNFRDVMCLLRLLPEDVLEDGIIGSSFGLECAGTVVAVGTAVNNFKVGDRVAALTPRAFSTHAIVPSEWVVKLPEGLPLEAAATIPAAFITAYYSLFELARLKRDEWLLVHAASGAVGLAAVQLAIVHGARVIATAGAEAKRELLRAIGVRHVLDSRSTRFVEEVRAITGSGVNVVLNSLAGDAMERSIACLAPFGRFIELGKRDYVANTHIGLRPFRQNLSYFGVDIDQVMARRPAIARKVIAKIMHRLQKGTLSPLPYCVFNSAEISEAFHLMQQAGHVGKIIVRPPDPESVPIQSKAFSFDSRRTHLITGGFSGLGLAAAKWLADRGARHIALVSRRGCVTDEARSVVADLVRQGINVRTEACDVANVRQVESLFENLSRAMPPLAGIIHAAMVLDDTIITNLTAERLNRVFAPKVKGAELLDHMTRGMQLDYFVLFSSFVALIGNRGQGSYVAANGYLQGLAHRRRLEGLPALAVAWGPITDVGVVARSERMRTDLRRIGGLRGMRAQEALDLMQLALGAAADDSSLAAITIAPHEAAFSSDVLPILKSPTYQQLTVAEGEASAGQRGNIDLRSLVSSQSTESIRETVIQVLVAQLARVLHLSEDDVSRTRSLAEMGLDSLMALELIMNLEEIFGIQLASARIAGNMSGQSLVGFADEIIASVRTERTTELDAEAAEVVERHVVSLEPEQINLLSRMIRKGGQQTGVTEPQDA